MNQQLAESYLQALLASVTIGVIIPLMILGVLLGIAWRVLVLAQRKPDFNIEYMLLDEKKKPSAPRFIMLMAFAISTWYLAVNGLSGKPDSQLYLYYLIAWSSSLAVLKLADKWNGQLPFAKSP